MKKAILLVECFLMVIFITYTLSMAISMYHGMIGAYFMIIYLNAWQYFSALIRIITGDKLRRNYFLCSSAYYFLFILAAQPGWFGRFEKFFTLSIQTIPSALTVWYLVVSFQDYFTSAKSVNKEN